MSRVKFPIPGTLAILAGLALWAGPGSANAGFSAPLAQCSAVTVPAGLSNCGNDPLVAGNAAIDDEGDAEVSVAGAGASQTYAVVFRSPDGSQSTTMGNLVTGPLGNGILRKGLLFPLNNAGAGNVVLTRAGSDQYVTALKVEAAGADQAPLDFRPALVRCADVNVPGSLSGCGSDTLKFGFVDVDADDGDLELEVNGAGANTSYTAVLLAPGGQTVSLGTLKTDSRGDGQLLAPDAFSAGVKGSGTVVLSSGPTKEFLSGFKVSEKPSPKPVAGSGLVSCIAVNDPPISGCGGDSLSSGSAVLGPAGKLTVKVIGAEPDTSYEVFFRPINNTGDIDTGLGFTTDDTGDAKNTVGFIKPGSDTVASGNFVVKSGGTDEFLTGFTIK